jgi:hypothetical protein
MKSLLAATDRCLAPLSALLTNSLQLMSVGLLDLKADKWFQKKGVSRGVSGRPSVETPALVGASRAHIECDVNVDSLAYWNDPQGKRDEDFVSPFKTKVRQF